MSNDENVPTSALAQPVIRKQTTWSIRRVKPDATNPRDHSAAQIDLLADSIRRYGWVFPIAVSPDGTIAAGHGRWQAALKLGMPRVSVVIFEDLSEEERRAFMVMDNRLAELATWNVPKLAVVVEELRAADVDLTGIGFSSDELDEIIASAAGAVSTSAQEPGSSGKARGNGPGKPTIAFQLIFDNAAQQDRWFALVALLRERYPDQDTNAARLDAWLAEAGVPAKVSVAG